VRGASFGVQSAGYEEQSVGCRILGSRVQGFGEQSAGCRVLGSRVQDTGCRFWDREAECGVQGANFGEQGAGLGEQSARCRVLGSRVQDAGHRVQVLGCRMQRAEFGEHNAG